MVNRNSFNPVPPEGALESAEETLSDVGIISGWRVAADDGNIVTLDIQVTDHDGEQAGVARVAWIRGVEKSHLIGFVAERNAEDLLDRYKRHLLAIFQLDCTCPEECGATCAPCIAEHALYLSSHPAASSLPDVELDHLDKYENGGRLRCSSCLGSS